MGGGARCGYSGVTAAPSTTPSRSIELTTRSPAARPATISVNSQLAMPVSTGRAAIVPVAASNTNTVLSGKDDRGREPQRVGALLENHLDVGAVAGEQACLLRIVELGLDLDRASLFFLVEHVRRHAPHVARKRLPGKGVETKPRR